MELKIYALARKTLGDYETVKNFYDDLAGELQVHPALVKMWAYKTTQVAAKHVIKIEQYTNGKVHRSDLRPDLYPPEEYKKAR